MDRVFAVESKELCELTWLMVGQVDRGDRRVGLS